MAARSNAWRDQKFYGEWLTRHGPVFNIACCASFYRGGQGPAVCRFSAAHIACCGCTRHARSESTVDESRRPVSGKLGITPRLVLLLVAPFAVVLLTTGCGGGDKHVAATRRSSSAASKPS